MAHKRNNSAQEPSYRRSYAHIIGWGMAVPEERLTNEDLEAIVETSDDWITARTGIKERRIANERESTTTLGFEAARRALEVADVLPQELDLIIVATSTPESIFPSTASLIQDRLGASKAGAFDLSAACSGFVYGVKMAADSIMAGTAKVALVIGAETMSRVMDWQDRGTCILFGDGAGAVVLKADTVEGGVLSSVLRSDGSGYDLLGIPTVGSCDIDLPGISANGHKMHKMFMNGGEVFKFATRVIGDSIQEAAEKAGITIDEIDLIIPHQANERIIKSAARNLKIDVGRFMSNVSRYGNTSAASIPIALTEAIQEGRVRQGNYLAFVGFGGGLTWASMIVKWGVPKPEERHAGRINRQRRQILYVAARWRSRWNRWKRRADETISRIRPQRGRMSRLKRKIEQHDIDLK